MHVKVGVEAEHSRKPQRRHAGELATDPHRPDDGLVGIVARVEPPANPHKSALVDGARQLAVGQTGRAKLTPGGDSLFEHPNRICRAPTWRGVADDSVDNSGRTS